METNELLLDAFSRIRGLVHRTVNTLTPAQLAFRPDPEANSIAWLIWHLTRIQDDHVADAAGREQTWMVDGFEKRFGLALPVTDTGYGHSSTDVAVVRVDDPDLLIEYHDAVHEQTIGYVQSLTAADYDRVVDTAWDPPVTLGVRLVSVVADNLQHVGQAAYVRGLLERAD